MSSSDDDPKNEPNPGATLVGGFARPASQQGRPGLPPPRSGASQAPPFRPSPASYPPSQPHATPAPGAVPQPEATAPQPMPPHPSGPAPQPMPPQPSGPAGGPMQGTPQLFGTTGTSGPNQGIPVAELLQSESSPIEQIAEVVGEIPGRFVGFLKISAKRAFRIRIEPTEVLEDERQMLAAANPPVTDANLQAFLAWRRSVLFLVATILAVLSIMGLIDSLIGKYVSSPVRFVKLLPTLAECAFCLICWMQLRNWTTWRKQRKWLLFGWMLFMLTPFLVFVYPIKTVFEETTSRALSIQQIQELGWYGVYNRAIAPFAFAMIAMLQLAPKVISLMPGLIRSSMVCKLLFPGSSAPGWLIVFCAPLYGLIAYALLVIPYQFTGEPWFMAGVLLIMVAQGILMRAGFRLARPMSHDEALAQIKTVRKYYVVLLITAALAIILGLGLLVKLLHMKWTSVVTTILKFECNVMILTTIGTDLVVTNLDRARQYTEGKEQIEQETEDKIAAFVGLNAPPT